MIFGIEFLFPSTLEFLSSTPNSSVVNNSSPNKQIYQEKDSESAGYFKLLPYAISDGDTFRAEYKGEKARFRLLAIDAPELEHKDQAIKEEYFAYEAKDFLADNILDKEIYASFDLEHKDKYGRYLVYIWTQVPVQADDMKELKQSLLNYKMIKEGYAEALYVKPNGKYKELMFAEEKKAREAELGMWSQD